MHEVTGEYVNVLNQVINFIGTNFIKSVIEFIKIIFLEVDSSGNVVGLSLWGSIIIVTIGMFLSITILYKILLVTILPNEESIPIAIDPSYISTNEIINIEHQEYLNKKRFQIRNRMNNNKNITIKAKPKKERKFDPIQDKKEAIEFERLKAERKARKASQKNN